MQDTKTFVRTLGEKLPEVNGLVSSYIPHGGCGVFAKALYERLIELGYTDIRLTVFMDKDADDDEFCRDLAAVLDGEQNTFSVYWSHVLVQINEPEQKQHYYVDNNGIRVITDEEPEGMIVIDWANRIGPNITYEQLSKLLTLNVWNTEYDHENDPIIYEFIRENVV